ncbi:hypothetical protein [Ferrimonas senticii]|uniref:hypothetical protein n=1 Tax=Ferrimonas senticii TaxID=394566 RepID=UPI001969EB07|nr:hypothetical protein [Ferrimonas senticii]
MEIIQEEYYSEYPDAQRIVTALVNSQNLVNTEKALLQVDKWRADLTPYHSKMLQDTEQGHWALWPQPESDHHAEEWVSIDLTKPLVARDPKSSINNGVVGIDFGTKSTVVVYQKDNVNIHPMRIGTGDLTKAVAASHYENPTIMQFCQLAEFIEQYQQSDFRPHTQWQQLTISHTAHSALLGSPSSQFNTFLDELKQWAGDKNRRLKIVDQQATVIDLPPFLEMSDDQFNPLEIYAYYLGLYINNQNNGIFLDYILSFPVTYELAIRERILACFERGLKKSLPPQLDADSISQLSVTQGASEPAAYALVALQQYQFAPHDDQRIFYGVFDFGGGTTDFDFGIYREAQGAKERRFDFVIEHFGAGGDRFLGGENLLELMAFDLFKQNSATLLAKGIQFERHPERDAFAGSEQLLAHSQEAKTNTKALCELLRPFWEGQAVDFNSGVIGLNLTDVNGTVHSNVELDIDAEQLEQLLRDRIERGVANFFNALRLAFSQQHSLQDITDIKIFLAGNSSRSKFVTELFAKHIQQQEQQMGLSGEQHCFELFAPLGSDANDIERPTGKTGVAFGLIESRQGGRIKVVDHNVQDDEIRFRYYLGENRRGQFKALINRETAFGQWIDFIDAGYHKFEIYYTEQPLSSTNQLPINDSSVKKQVVRIDHINENALVYLRIVSPTAIEWVVASEDGIAAERYLTEPQRVEF